MKKRKSERRELSRRMLAFFLATASDGQAPSFDKFARQEKMTLSELEALCEDKDFNEAYRECGEIRRDYLIDAALTKRFDPSFVKFLLSLEDEKETDGAKEISVTVTVVD